MSFFWSAAVEALIRTAIRSKLNAYNPEPASMPFQVRLLGQDRMALFSFIQSINTSLGTSIYESVAKAVADSSFDTVTLQANPPRQMSRSIRHKVDEIVNGLEAGYKDPNRDEHDNELRSVLIADNDKVDVNLTKVDVLLQRGDTLYLVDVKTAKPNKSGFRDYKRTLLEWLGAYLEFDPRLDIYPMIAIPCNPYAPKPYRRWTIRGMIDINNELRVAEEFWDFLGGDGAYEEILDCFERVGIEMRDEIDSYFAQFSSHSKPPPRLL